MDRGRVCGGGGNKQMGEGERSNKWESPRHHFRGKVPRNRSMAALHER